MNAYAYTALNSASSIAIETATSQGPRGVVVPFPSPSGREEIAANSMAIGEALAEAMQEAIRMEPAAEDQPEAEQLPNVNALVERQHLASAIDMVSLVIEPKHYAPILLNARLQANGNSVKVTASDLDIEVSITVPAAIDGGFDITLPAKKLKELLKGAPKADYVALENKGGQVSADFEKVRYNLVSLPAADFPAVPGPKEGAYFMMRGADIAGGLDAVSGAISTEETRYYLNGIFLERCESDTGAELRMVATDGHRLYLQKLELPGAIGSWPAMSYMQGVIVPSKTVAMLSKLMRGKKCPDFIAMTIASNACRFVFSTEFGEVTVLSKNIDGTFPDYRRVVPAHSNFPAARFDRCGLAEGIKAASLISSEKSRAFKLSVSGNGASVTVNSPENGSAHADMPCKWESDETEIGFNAGYMLDALDIAGSGETAIYIQDSSSPAVVTGAREGWLAVIMPMRV